jgi:hypothetical protein
MGQQSRLIAEARFDGAKKTQELIDILEQKMV